MPRFLLILTLFPKGGEGNGVERALRFFRSGFNPQAGHEQAWRQPALVVSLASDNGKVGLAVLCPITNQVKDWRARRAAVLCRLPKPTRVEVLQKLAALISSTGLDARGWPVTLHRRRRHRDGDE